MRTDVVTLFPELFEAPLRTSLLGQAVALGKLEVGVTDLRGYGLGPHRSVDDEPYGGGAGMVMRPEPIFSCVEELKRDESHVVLLSARGARLDHALVTRLADLGHMILICGRYEGVDERVRDKLADDAISIGPYVLSGGEPAAMVVADAVLRKLPGALGHADSALEESFSEALGGAPEYPHYTRPASYRGWDVPEVLLSGAHERVREWRRQRSSERAEPPETDLGRA